ncbi:hypothetical protein [Pontimicrobium sp. MEBiC01747]
MNKLSLILIFLIILSCKKDDDYTSDNNSINEQAISDTEFAENNFGSLVKSSFIGEIVNEDGGRVNNAQVIIGGISTYTDHNGIFVLNEVNVYENFALIKATKEGYVLGSKVIIPDQNGVNNIKITLLKKDIIGSVNSGENSEISLPNGSKVTFQGDFIRDNGTPYSGQVDVVMHYLEPNEANIFTEMPGMLFGMRGDGTASAMETYGMLSINLFTPSGESLNISETSSSNIEFPISSTHQNSPSEVPLWYFDEEVGYWKEQGKALKSGNKYIAEVSHFSWWNCDIPFNYINFCYTLLDGTTTNELSNINVEIIRNNTGELIFYGTTNINGTECGIIPINEEITFNIYGNDECVETIVYSETLGPYLSNVSETINVTNLPSELQTTLLTGTLNTCSGGITNGYALIYESGASPYSNSEIVSIIDGTINYPMTYCVGSNYTMIVLDIESSLISEEIAIIPNTAVTTIEEVNVCGNAIGGVYNGDVILESQLEVDVFGLFGYSEITGDLTIGALEISGETDITSLNTLSNLTTVGGEVVIVRNSVLTTLTGLDNLNSIFFRLNILSNDSLTSIINFDNLTTQANQSGFSIIISNNSSLTGITGFNNLSTLNNKTLWISGNPQLTSITGFSELESTGSLFLTLNESLVDISGLSNLSVIESSFYIRANNVLNSLIDLTGLTSVGSTEISYNDSLVSLSGLENVTNINGSLSIKHNDNLESISELNSIENISGSITISWNNSISSLSDFNNLISVASIEIRENPILTTMSGFENLNQILGLGLLIYDNPVLEEVSGFNNLTSNGVFTLINNPNLISVSGFDSLISNGSITIEDNNSLTTFSAGSNLNSSGSFSLLHNDALTSISGLNNLTSISGDFIIDDNDALYSFDWLGNLETIDGLLWIRGNDSLTTISGLTSLTYIGENLFINNNMQLGSLTGLNSVTSVPQSLNISNNASLLSLEGLNSLTTVGTLLKIFGNSSLATLDGLNNLTSVGSQLSIGGPSNGSVSGPNPLLTDFCALTNLFTNGTYSSLDISHNGYNPTVQNIIDGDCSQ